MVRDHRDSVRRIVRKAVNMGLGDALRMAARDITYLDKAQGQEIEALIGFLVGENMIVELGPTISGGGVDQDLEAGVGENHAWQIPIYRVLVLEALSQKKSSRD